MAATKAATKTQKSHPTALSTCSSWLACSAASRNERGDRDGAVAAKRSANISPAKRKGTQYTPHADGPTGVTHNPPAQAARKTGKKKVRNLRQLSFRPKPNRKIAVSNTETNNANSKYTRNTVRLLSTSCQEKTFSKQQKPMISKNTPYKLFGTTTKNNSRSGGLLNWLADSRRHICGAVLPDGKTCIVMPIYT